MYRYTRKILKALCSQEKNSPIDINMKLYVMQQLHQLLSGKEKNVQVYIGAKQHDRAVIN